MNKAYLTGIKNAIIALDKVCHEPKTELEATQLHVARATMVNLLYAYGWGIDWETKRLVRGSYSPVEFTPNQIESLSQF